MNLRLKKRPPALLVVLIILMILALLAHFQAAPLTFIDQALTTPLQAIVTPTKTFLMRPERRVTEN